MVLALLSAGMFGLSVLAGMFGVGVAFAAIPLLGLVLQDLVHEVQPLALLLNGLTAAASAVGFIAAGAVPWRQAMTMAAVTSVLSPFGAMAAPYVAPAVLWVAYFTAAGFALYRLSRPVAAAGARARFGLGLVLAVPISLLAGLLGLGPGFLLVPALMLCGIPVLNAAAINAVAVTPSSFVTLAPHLAAMRVDWMFALPLLAAGVTGAALGARLATHHVSEQAMKAIFIVTVAAVCLAKASQLVLAASG